MFSPGFEVHPVERAFCRLLERIEHHLSVVAHHCHAKWMIHGRLNQDFVARLRQGVYCHADAFHHSRNVCQPLRLDVPAVVVGYPFAHCGPVFFRLDGIAENSMFQSLPDGINDELWGFEIHVSHPQRYQVVASITRLQHLVLQVARARAVYYLVEVVFHFVIHDFAFF